MTNPASKGRNGDSVLVHMSPNEVKGLAALAEMHGRQLTINPETGYPEAFSLGDILPTVVGLGASAATGGALSPWLAGGLAGLTSYATTGSLEKGLLTGLTAGGLSALGNNLAATGAEAATANAANSMVPTTDFLANNPDYAEVIGATKANVAQNGAAIAAPAAAPQGVAGGQNGLFGTAMQRFGDMGRGIKTLTQNGGWGDFLSANKKPLLAAGMGLAGNIAYDDQMRRREALEEEREARERDKQRDYTRTVADIRDNYAAAGRPFTLGSLSASPNFNRKYYASGGLAESDKNQIYQDIALSYLDAGRKVPSYLTKYLPENNKGSSSPVRRYAGQGGGLSGIVYQVDNPISFGGIAASPVLYRGPQSYALPGLEGRNQNYVPQPFERVQDKMQGPRQLVANTNDVLAVMDVPRGTAPAAPAATTTNQGAVAPATQVLQEAGMNPATKRMATGGEVVGAGDGMSDDIMTTIDGTEPAALSDGEFVIPADVVSHLGNGSTDAGARRLYEMMARVRKARTGKARQAKEIDAEKMLPA